MAINPENFDPMKGLGTTQVKVGESYKNEEWYKSASPEEQKQYDETVEKKGDLLKKIETFKAEKDYKGKYSESLLRLLEKVEIQDDEDEKEVAGFNKKIDTLNRDIDLLERMIYEYQLEVNREELMSSFEKSNEYFKKGLLKEGESDPDVLRLIETKDLSTITAGEIYSLKQAGYDLSKLLLIGGGEQVSKDSMKIGNKFKVNFGGNNSLNATIGAGDLLPIERFDKVKINGVIGTRKLSPRPGYYAENGKYLAVYDNYEIEIISEKIFNEEETKQSEEAFKIRYLEIRKPEVLFNFKGQLDKAGNNNELVLTGFSKYDLENVINPYLSKYLPKEVVEKVDFDLNTGVLKINTGENLGELSKHLKFENLGSGIEKYRGIAEEVAKDHGIAPEDLIRLINHENRKWDPLATARGSSAYGLGQMIDGTWATYGKGLERDNPEHQLIATCKYLKEIMGTENCSVKLAMAYYNTGEGIMNVSQDKIEEYARLNPAISIKIPTGISLNNKSYFTAAVAYYNDISYEQARGLS